MGAMLVLGPVVTGRVDGDPLLTQIQALKARVQYLSNVLVCMLDEKIKSAAEAATSMANLKGPMDQLEEALMNSSR
jgi:hypothetical protein